MKVKVCLKKANSLLEKALSAALFAIELYSKINIEYGEESFAILIINAYETNIQRKSSKRYRKNKFNL